MRSCYNPSTSDIAPRRLIQPRRHFRDQPHACAVLFPRLRRHPALLWPPLWHSAVPVPSRCVPLSGHSRHPCALARRFRRHRVTEIGKDVLGLRISPLQFR
ncbi:uncharacterized protein LOC143696236 [Agelaius phoeniceus]|uniref:uncharacterized protein LOC143696236 n=1 Tax=Agelaius phoeniceus TaxID=39638 RepID=UPI0040551F86